MGPKVGGHEFTCSHHPGTGTVAQFPDQGDSGADLSEFLELSLKLRADRDLKFRGQAAMPLLDGVEHLVLRADQRRLDQLFQLVGNAGDGGVNDQYARAGVQARSNDLRDVAPVGQR